MSKRGPNYDDGQKGVHLDCPKCGAALEIGAEDINEQCLRNKTLRDEFAMAALPSCITEAELTMSPLHPCDQAARGAYKYADAMMEARK